MNIQDSKSLQALLNYPELESIHIGSSRKKIKYNSSIFNNFKDLTELGCDLENVKLNLPKVLLHIQHYPLLKTDPHLLIS